MMTDNTENTSQIQSQKEVKQFAENLIKTNYEKIVGLLLLSLDRWKNISLIAPFVGDVYNIIYFRIDEMRLILQPMIRIVFTIMIAKKVWKNVSDLENLPEYRGIKL